MWLDAAATAGVELLAVARPGYAESAAVEMRAVADWPSLLGPLLDTLGWARFAAIGISAGAPYAYALAALWSGRVTGVAICSGLPAVCEPEVLAHYPEDGREAYARYARASREEVAEEMRGFIEGVRAQFPADHPMQRSFDASLGNGVVGPAREAQLQIRPWGFALSEVSCPVRLFHARDDSMAPFAAVAATVERLPAAEIVPRETGGHMFDEDTVRAAVAFVAENAAE